MKNILEIKNLNHSYAKELATITDFSFSLKKGEIVNQGKSDEMVDSKGSIAIEKINN